MVPLLYSELLLLSVQLVTGGAYAERRQTDAETMAEIERLPYPPDEVIENVGSQAVVCNGHGSLSYLGPDKRTICACLWGWKGVDCSKPFAEKDYGPFRSCSKLGERDTCPSGLGCNIVTNAQNKQEKRCACNVESKNKACNPYDLLGCQYQKCEEGLECYKGSCQCKPFSEHPMCQCTGQISLGTDLRDVACARGDNGYCVVDGTNQTCSFIQSFVGVDLGLSLGEDGVEIAAERGPGVCEPGMGLNALWECVCVPLSTNQKCLSKPPANGDASNICARYSYCRKPFDVEYTVLQSGKVITTDVTSIRPKKSYAIVTDGIGPDQGYLFCTKLRNPEGWTKYTAICAENAPPGQECCFPVQSSRGIGNFTAGCADFAGVYYKYGC